MKRKSNPTLSFRTAITLLVMMLTSVSAWATITGSGTQADPYVIHDIYDWNNAASKQQYYYNNNTHVYLELAEDIDFGNVSSSFLRFGQESTCYIHFDGKGHTISGITMNCGNKNNASPFADLASGSTISNLTVASSSFSADSWVAGITTKNKGGIIDNCHVESSVTLTANKANSQYCGGIAAQSGWFNGATATTGTITNCTVGAKFVLANCMNQPFFGGIVGRNYSASAVSGCLNYSTSVTSGLNFFSSIVASYSTSNEAVITNNYYRPVGNYGHGAPSATVVRAVSGIPSGITCPAICISHGGYDYIAENSTFTLTAPAHKAFNTDFSVSGTGTRYSLASDKTSASVTIGSADATVNASLRNFAYTVVFKGNGSTSGAMSNQAFDYGISQNLTANGFTRTGYTYAGWATSANGNVAYTNQQNVNNLTATDGGTVNLYAKWTPITYTVQFNGNGNTTGTMSNQTYTYDVAQTLTANAFSRTGYTFAGWATSANGNVAYTNQQNVNNLTATDGGTVNLYAKWTPITYTVVFKGNGSTSGAMSNQAFDYSISQNLTANGFTRTGYTFAGWATSANGDVVYSNLQSVSNLTTTNGATITLYAKWTVHTYTVHFDKNHNDVTGSMGDMNFTYDVAQQLTANGFSRTHYDFTGWNTQADGNGTSFNDQQNVQKLTTTDKGTIDLYAQWMPHAYTISYDLDGGSADNPATYTVESSDIKLNTPTRKGYVFTGWTGTDLAATTTSVTIGHGSSGNRSYTATWEAVAFSVSFNGNGNTSGTMNNQDFAYDKAKPLTANAFGRAFTVTYDYNGATGGNTAASATAVATFNGWATSADGAVAYADKQSVSNLTTDAGATVELYANWADASVTLPAPTRTGYTFVEWCSDADLTAKVGDAGDVITPNADITLYAHWILNTSIDVSFTSPMNSGDDAYLTVTMTPKDISIEPNPITTVAKVNVDSKSYFVPIVNGVGTCIVRNLMEKREYVGFDEVTEMDIYKFLPFDIQAVFDGDDQYKASTSDIKQLTVEMIPTTLTVSVDKTTVNEGEPLTVTVELEPKIDACVTVKAMVPDDTEYRNNYNLWLDKGRGTKTFYGLPAGPRNINANFAGDDRYARSSCKNVRITVNKVETTVETVVSSPVIAK